MSDNDVFDGLIDGTPTEIDATGGENFPLHVTEINDQFVRGRRMDTGIDVRVRLSDAIESRNFNLADKVGDWPAGSVVTVDGAVPDFNEEGLYLSRWINRVSQPHERGFARFGMARIVYDADDQGSKYKSKVEFIGGPTAVTTPDEMAQAAARAIASANQMDLGWPRVAVVLRNREGTRGAMKTWSAAATGQVGQRRMSDFDSQLRQFSSGSFKNWAVKACARMEERGMTATIHPTLMVRFGLRKGEALDNFYLSMPPSSDKEARIAFMEAQRSVNEYTRFPLDEDAQAMFSPCYLAFKEAQGKRPILIAVRQLNTRGPYYGLGDISNAPADMTRALWLADKYNRESNRQAPSHDKFRHAVTITVDQARGMAAAGTPVSEQPTAVEPAPQSPVNTGEPNRGQPDQQTSAQPEPTAPPQSTTPSQGHEPAPASSEPVSREDTDIRQAPAARPAADTRNEPSDQSTPQTAPAQESAQRMPPPLPPAASEEFADIDSLPPTLLITDDLNEILQGAASPFDNWDADEDDTASSSRQSTSIGMN
jgi:hypothetical protein